MAIKYVILYHPKVVHDDIPLLTKAWRDKVRIAIEEKLLNSPEIFGKPLRRTLKNYRKLRVGDYRIVFRLEKRGVIIFAIQHRSVVYKIIMQRL